MVPIIADTPINDQSGERMISAFFNEFRVNAHLRTASTGKSKGIPLGVVFQLVFRCAQG